MTNRSSSQWLGPGEAARRLGVSVKALRVYERAGLVSPDRREGGWRHYGPDSLERLHCVLALKALGMSLADIRALIDSPTTDLGSILELQAKALSAELVAVRERLDRIRRAQHEIGNAGHLSSDAWLALSQRRPAVEMSPDQVLAFVVRMAGSADPAGARPVPSAQEVEIAAIVAEASRLLSSGCSSTGPEAIALAARWQELRAAIEPHNPDIRAAADDLLTSRALAPALDFLRAAVDHWRRSAAASKEA